MDSDKIIELYDFDSEESRKAILNMNALIKNKLPLEAKAKLIIESTENEINLMQKDPLDRFIEYAFFKAKTGYPYIENLAYPTKRIVESDIEETIILLLNNHLMPEITFRILKFFTRNARNSDTNLYLAYLIKNEDLIKSIYETYKTFKNDIFKDDPEHRSMNVKSIQQYISVADNKFSSPLDAACRLKYILEYLSIKQNTSSIYTAKDLKISEH
ncbi:MAG TPA: hypothetical protein PLA54_08950 [Spirochaetota bacterium]|nr:hypothetical protein [Spirochaetota bacterium]